MRDKIKRVKKDPSTNSLQTISGNAMDKIRRKFEGHLLTYTTKVPSKSLAIEHLVEALINEAMSIENLVCTSSLMMMFLDVDHFS